MINVEDYKPLTVNQYQKMSKVSLEMVRNAAGQMNENFEQYALNTK